ncbi:bypass-of-forespore protein C [Halobacillus fulvus]|nr:bypass-of-forespore protein C [Halobacillus fulvus]
MRRAICFLLILMIVSGCQQVTNPKDLPGQRKVELEEKMSSSVPTLVQASPLELKVVLKEYYIDGVVEITNQKETIWSMMDFWAAYDGWTVEEQTKDQIVFQRQHDDLSPLTKKAGYFGLTPNGEIAVFQGLPVHGKIIESFKPVPLKPMESRRKSILEDGIKIKDREHFQQVLNRYSTSA